MARRRRRIGEFRALLVLLLATLVPGSAARAGDVARHQLLGFSKDGRRLAFANWTECGDADASVVVRVVDVEANRFVGETLRLAPDDRDACEHLTWSAATRAIGARLREHGVDWGRVGHHVVSHLETDRSFDPHHVRFAARPLWSSGGPGARSSGESERGEEYELALTTMPAECPASDGRKGLKLRLAIRRVGTDRTVALQWDDRLPASRGCPFAYAIRDVFVHEPFVAVFLDMATPGLEGEDHSTMAVTGRLP